MAEIYVLDSSAMDTLNELESSDESLIDQLVELRDSGSLLYSESVKEDRREFAKREPMTVWASSGWRSIQSRAALSFSSVQAVLHLFNAYDGPNIMNMDDPDNVEQAALTTVALAYQLCDVFDVRVVSDEIFTSENRCTVLDACTVLQLKHVSVVDFLDATASG